MGNDSVNIRFERIRDDGKIIKFKIQELRKCDVEKVVDYLSKWYIYEENFVRCCGVPNTKESKQEFLEAIQSLIMEDGNCLVCSLDDGDDDNIQIAGCNVLYLTKKSEPELNFGFQTNEVKTLFKLFEVLHHHYDEIEALKIEEFIGGAGLSVHPEYRRLGLATELFKARKPLLERLGVSVTGAWFTSIGSQKAALAAGYQEVANISFEELEKLTGIHFTDVPKTAVFGILKI